VYSRRRSGAINQRGDTLPNAYAERCEAVLQVAANHVVGQPNDEARAAASKRMSDSDCAAVWIDQSWVEVEFAHARQRLRREGLV
jgi:hypothetical protein